MRRTATDNERSPLAGGRPWGDAWTARGVVETLEPLVSDARKQRLLEVIEQRLGSVTVVMDAPHDPHNGSAVVRSCDAFGIQRLHVIERNEPFLIARRIARGSQYWVDVIGHPNAEQGVSELRADGFELVSTAPDGTLLPSDLRDIERVAVILGNEHDGICAALRSAATRSVRIPMRGFVESLNVSVCAAILLHAATEGRSSDLSVAERSELYARGLFHSVARAGEVLAASGSGW